MTVICKENFIPNEICDKIIDKINIIHDDDQYNNNGVRWYHHYPKEFRDYLDSEIRNRFRSFIGEDFFREYIHFELMTFRYRPRVYAQTYVHHYDCEKRLNLNVMSDLKFVELFGRYEAYRQWTTVWYLNEDYEGGEINFRQHKLMIKPKKGMFITYPGDKEHVHCVMPVTKGIRYSISIWFGKDYVPD